ncbi:MAG TPA: GMC family oxidoreductase [Candidatus Acidoferrales bacterium]|jgi:choline dehydrogenase-like flavoprotein|nr:GMC family oxidoreductase [Candidatus Acidoferrales bacterium]
MPQVVRNSPVYDVVVIGSGAGGGTVTKVLADLGVSVLLMEAGPMFNPAKDIKEHMWPYQVPHRGVGPHGEGYFGRSPFTFSASFGGAQLDGEPYTVAPGSDFSWFRSRILGGRTNHYGRFSLRFADYDFKPHSRDGLGWDWPVSYEDISPYYDKAETFIGVVGTKEGIRSAPDGIFQTPAAPKVHDILTKKACGKLGIPCIPMRSAIITQPTNGRAPCHYCGQCGRACMTASNYASSYVQIFPAMKTGRVKVITNAMARELLTDDAGKVRAVSYVDKNTRGEQQVRCRTVVLAASACESARLLLNSKSPRHPAGLANSSGVVGRYLTDTVGTGLSGHIPALEGLPHYNSDGYGTHMYIPWWLWEKQKDVGFPRGYHVELGGGFGMPGVGSFQATCQRHEGYGLGLKKAIREEYGTGVSFSGRGEMIPNEKSYCEIDPQMVDRWGIPVLRFHWEWSDHELKQAEHQVRTFAEIIHAMGGTVTGGRRGSAEAGGGTGRQVISRGGAVIHEIGTVRMGDDPKTSVLNRYCQSHDVKNLFVADGGPFVSNSDKNPTLTIIALAWRTAEYLAEEMRKGNV